MDKYMMDVKDITEILGVSRAKAYAVIRSMNSELEKQGYIVVSGKIPRAFWETKFYSYPRKKPEG